MSVSEKMANYELSQAAERDFESIFEYGIDTFGLDQALRYQNGMVQRFDKLAAQPRLYPAVDHIRAGYRRQCMAPIRSTIALIATVLSLRVSWASRISPTLLLELRAVRDGWLTKQNGTHLNIAHRLVGRLFPLEPPRITRHMWLAY